MQVLVRFHKITFEYVTTNFFNFYNPKIYTKLISETSTQHTSGSGTETSSSSVVFKLNPPLPNSPESPDEEQMSTEAFSISETGMDLHRSSDTAIHGSSASIHPSDATDVGTSGISSQMETHTTDLTEGQKFARAQKIMDEGYVKLARLSKLLHTRPDSDDNVYHPDM